MTIIEETVPAGWATSSLGDITITKVDQAAPSDRPVPYIDISSIDRASKSIGELRNVDSDSAPTRARQRVKEGDVLVSMTRPNLNAVAIVPGKLDGAVASTGFDVLRSVGVDPKWVFNRVRSHAFVQDVCEGLQGVVYPAIRPRDVRDHVLPLPPLPEQHRIVEAIESYLSRLDDAVANLERVQRNLKRYRASVLKAAVEGRLVPTEAELARKEGRDFEPASVLLERILKERRHRWEENGGRGKYKEPVEPDTTGLADLPEGWCWANVEQLSDQCRSVTYGVVKLGDVTPGGVPTLRSSNVRHLHLDLEYVKPISQEIAGSYRRTFLEGGEVLVTVRGTLGGVSVVPDSCRGFNISREVAMIALVDPKTGPALSYLIASPLLQKWMMKRTRGITYRGVNIETLKQLPVPLPPADEQDRISRSVERYLSVEEKLRTTSEASTARCTRLRQSILKWAFEGKLVDQDPNDEPASVLLERIRKERQAQPSKPKPKRTRKTQPSRRAS
jgi:type I restriction enzyme, S subunit